MIISFCDIIPKLRRVKGKSLFTFSTFSLPERERLKGEGWREGGGGMERVRQGGRQGDRESGRYYRLSG